MECVWQEKNDAWNNKTLKTQCECNSSINDQASLINLALFIIYNNWSHNGESL